VSREQTEPAIVDQKFLLNEIHSHQLKDEGAKIVAGLIKSRNITIHQLEYKGRWSYLCVDQKLLLNETHPHQLKDEGAEVAVAGLIKSRNIEMRLRQLEDGTGRES
jgi:hypothetical protein